jgi:hypothetical protein
MPLDLQIIRASEFVRMGAEGHFDLNASRAALSELAAACLKRGVNRALVDLRKLHPQPKPIFTPDDLASLINTFREMGFTKEHRLAVLYTEDPHHRARDFAFMSRLRGWHVCAFDDFEAALNWLSGEEEDLADYVLARGESVPVKPERSQSLPRSKPKIKPRH